MATRAFGPATAAVLLLLWIMIIASLLRFGFNLPSIDLRAFSPEYFHFTLGGYARILALMTGIEIFANLVAAYDGTRAQKSRKAFGSLIIIMGTTSLTMLIVGPAIFALADVNNAEVSVFTQTMDQLLPPWVSYLGTLTGIAVLLSACAASAQGLQNLSLGLRYRHYIPANFGQKNHYDVADRPVWLEVGIVIVCFLLFGTHEETYLALYAAGVFILLSMTGWAASKRLWRELRQKFAASRLLSLSGTITAAFLTTAATFIIFSERFFEGAWSYLVMVPVLYFAFTFYRNRLGAPTSVEDRLGLLVAEQRYLPEFANGENTSEVKLKRILVPLNGSMLAEQSLPMARHLADVFKTELILASVNEDKKAENAGFNEYLERTAGLISGETIEVQCIVGDGEPAQEINRLGQENAADLIVISTKGGFEIENLFSASVSQRLIEQTSLPILLLRPTDDLTSRFTGFKKIIVALDGSEESESVLPLVKKLADKFDNEVLLISVPEGAESENYAVTMEKYLDGIAAGLNSEKHGRRFY
ncbi:MAG: universal stress protein [Blastocatellia bacterium]|nr:universal stress protein [Blastocatellia bacterium]